MNAPDLINRLALHRQRLDETRRAALVPVVGTDGNPQGIVLDGVTIPLAVVNHVDLALTHLQLALTALDPVAVAPTDPWIVDLRDEIDA